MTIEYRLEKKVLGGWQTVSWWGEREYDKAHNSFIALATPLCGYHYRLIKIEVVEECKLEEETPVYKDEVAKIWNTPESQAKANVWAGNKPVNDGWGNVSRPNDNNDWSNENGKYPSFSSTPSINKEKPSEHGMSGKVWLIHHALKQKKRVDPAEVDGMIAEGWERGGPKTAFRS